MSFLYENLAAIYIAIMASVLAWLFGGTRSDLLVPTVPWLMLFMAEVLFFFPQKRANESTYEARSRVWRDMKRDPLVWTALGFVLLLVLPFVNNGLCVNCDAETIALGISPDPPVTFLPFCVNRMEHLNVFLWFVAALSCMVATKHSLNSTGKRLVLEMIVWNGVALAVLGFVQSAMNAPGPLWSELADGKKAGDFFSTFGYPNMGGDYFTTLFGLSVALWRWHYEEGRTDERHSDSGDARLLRSCFWRKNYMLLAAAVTFYAALNTLSRASILLVTSLAAVFFVHTLVSFLSRMNRAKRFKRGVWSLLVLGLIIFAAAFFMPADMQREVDTLGATVVLDRVTGRGQYHARVATELWKDHLLFGCGGWGYKHFCISKMTPEELKQIQMVGGINVHNDYLQFLAEHGLVGFGALLAMVIMLIWPIARVWKELAGAARFAKGKDRPPRPVQLFALPAPIFCVLMTVLATFIHGFGDCPLRSPAVMSLFFIQLAAMPGFAPHLKFEKED